MKKNMFLLLCVGALGLAINTVFATNNNIENNECKGIISFPYGVREIELDGDLILSSGPNAIVAGVGSDAIYIEFSQNLGNVTIILQSESGWAYNTVVNTGVVQLVVIPINNNFSGSYLLEISNATGFAEGSFIR